MSVLRARRLEKNDLPTRVLWMNDPAVGPHLMLDLPVSLANTARWFETTLLNSQRWDLVFELKGDGHEPRPVAMGGLVEIDHRHRRAELYMFVSPDHRRRGIGTAVLQWLCRFGFTECQLERIYLYTLEDNSAAQSLYQRAGFVHEGTLRSHAVHLGRRIDRPVFGLLRDEWLHSCTDAAPATTGDAIEIRDVCRKSAGAGEMGA